MATMTNQLIVKFSVLKVVYTATIFSGLKAEKLQYTGL
jgi:hypothetical protein